MLKHCKILKQSIEANDCSNEANECSDNEKATIVSNAKCVHTQTDLTVKSLTALEVDYHERMIEASQHQCTTGPALAKQCWMGTQGVTAGVNTVCKAH